MFMVLATVLPVFALIAAGFGFGRWRPVGAEGVALLNAFVVWLALPALLFQVLADARWKDLVQPGFLAAFSIGIAVTFLLSFFLAGRGADARAPLAKRSLDALTASYANTAFLGIPLAEGLLGQAALAPAVLASILTVCVLFGVSIILVEYDLNAGGRLAPTIGRVAGSLARNPLLVSPVLGALWAATGMPLPAPVRSFTTLLGAAATPCALVTIGAFLALPRPATGGGRDLGLTIALKLLVQPAMTAILALGVFRMAPLWSAAAILLSALPTGTGPFMVAQLYRQDVTLASRAILLSTLLSVLTVSLLALVLRA